mmetsp:Transcript_59919/g.157563  ORF Transcript_59919/g.157563 Transcript_59919/m.157563 type:complete len:379 (-) Transcript_59919:117-1253(-)
MVARDPRAGAHGERGTLSRHLPGPEDCRDLHGRRHGDPAPAPEPHRGHRRDSGLAGLVPADLPRPAHPERRPRGGHVQERLGVPPAAEVPPGVARRGLGAALGRLRLGHDRRRTAGLRRGRRTLPANLRLLGQGRPGPLHGDPGQVAPGRRPRGDAPVGLRAPVDRRGRPRGLPQGLPRAARLPNVVIGRRREGQPGVPRGRLVLRGDPEEETAPLAQARRLGPRRPGDGAARGPLLRRRLPRDPPGLDRRGVPARGRARHGRRGAQRRCARGRPPRHPRRRPPPGSSRRGPATNQPRASRGDVGRSHGAPRPLPGPGAAAPPMRGARRALCRPRRASDLGTAALQSPPGPTLRGVGPMFGDNHTAVSPLSGVYNRLD